MRDGRNCVPSISTSLTANPLGANIFDPKAPKFSYTIEKGKTTTFKYRVVLYDGAVGAEALNKEADGFAAGK